MPDIDSISKKPARQKTPEDLSDESSSKEEVDAHEPMEIPGQCLACGKEKVTHLTVPCRHPCLCRGCAMKMATGGRCKVNPLNCLAFTALLRLY